MISNSCFFFIQKLHNVTLDHQNTIQLINFSVWTPFKMSSDSFLGWSITTKKKLNTTRDLKYKEPQKQEMNIIIQGNEKKQARVSLYLTDLRK